MLTSQSICSIDEVLDLGIHPGHMCSESFHLVDKPQSFPFATFSLKLVVHLLSF